ncbi:MAG: hypothetical protein U0359_03000 [Byssovorax sp.]
MNDSARIAALELQVGELQRKLDFVTRHLGITYQEPSAPPAIVDVTALLRQGNKLGAVKAYQEHTGVGLREAKEAVEAIEKKLTAR